MVLRHATKKGKLVTAFNLLQPLQEKDLLQNRSFM